MMEQEVSDGESEMTALRDKIQVLSDQIDIQRREQQSEARKLSEQLKQAHSNIVSLCQQSRSFSHLAFKSVRMNHIEDDSD